MVIEVQRTFEGQKRAQIGPEGGLKDAGFMESRVESCLESNPGYIF